MRNKFKILCFVIFLCVPAVLYTMGCSEKKQTETGYNNDVVLVDSITLEPDEEGQPYWHALNCDITKSENGYYFKRFTTYYIDAEYMKRTVLCAKPDCDHSERNNPDCLARIGSSSIYYYNGFCYTTEYSDETGNLMLIQLAPDGTSYREMFEINLPTLTETNWLNVFLVFADDSVFIYNKGGRRLTVETQGDIVIRRRSLDGKEDEIVYTYTGDGCFFEAVKYYGGKLFFTVKEGKTDVETRQNTMVSRGLYVYDVDSKEVVRLLDEQVCDYSVDMENNIIYYYVLEDGLYKKKLSGGEAELLYKAQEDTGICFMSFDGQYIYLDNSRWFSFADYTKIDWTKMLIVMDTDGKEVNRIDTLSYTVLFGDSDYLFATGGKGLCYIPKKDIASAREFTYVQ